METRLMCRKISPETQANNHVAGSAYLAGQLRPIIAMTQNNIGIKAINAYTGVIFIIFTLLSINYIYIATLLFYKHAINRKQYDCYLKEL